MPLLRLLLLLWLALALPAAAAAQAQSDDAAAAAATTPAGTRILPRLTGGLYNPERAILANGLEVFVVHNPRLPVVAQYLWHRVGGADEPRGQSGVAHMLEHMMFQGTTKVPAGEFSRRIGQLGGQDNAFTSWDYTAYFQKVHRDDLDLILELEADRAQNAAFKEEDFLTERNVVLEERRQRTESSPRNLFYEAVDSALYRSHPYSIPIIGWGEEIAQLTNEQALAFYRVWYAPNNSALLLVGDVTLEQALPLIERHYGPIPSKPVPERNRGLIAPLTGITRIHRAEPLVRQVEWSRTWLAPSYASAGTETPDGLNLLASILGEGETSRLYQRLVVQDRLASDIGAYYQSGLKDSGSFTVIVEPLPGQDPAVIETAVQEELDRLIKDGVTEAELTRARRRLTASAVYAQDSFATAAYRLGMAWATGRDIAEADAWLPRLQAVTSAQIQQAAASVLTGGSIIGTLVPAESADAASVPPAAAAGSAVVPAAAATPALSPSQPQAE